MFVICLFNYKINQEREDLRLEITFLIGNGFDVGVGLKSKFSNYFNKYIAESKDKSVSLKGLADSIDSSRAEWSYFEKELGNYTEKFDKNNYKVFLEQIKDFEKGFIAYLKEEETKLCFDAKEKISQKMIKALTSFCVIPNLPNESNDTFRGIFTERNRETRTYNFISFNYTSVLEKCLDTISNKTVNKRTIGGNEYVDKIGEIAHVHGYIDNAPIMGVNDIEQIKNKELANINRFSKYIVKPTLNKLLRLMFDSNATRIINKSSIICVYGMALGETDKKWWNYILSWLNNSSDRQLVLFVYDNEFSVSSQFDWLEKEDEIIDKLDSFCVDKKINVNILRPRIHLAVHKNIFEMDLTKSGIKEKELIEV